MSSYKKLLSQEFGNAFLCLFNSDLFDIRDRDEAIDRALFVVNDLLQRGISAQDIIGPLTQALAQWNSDVIDEFSDASDTDWSYDKDAESLLKEIVQEMIRVAPSRETKDRPDTNVE